MKVDLYNPLIAEYAELRKKATLAASAKKAAVYEKIPELATLDSEIADAGFEYAKAMMDSDDTELPPTDKIQKLKLKRAEILRDAGYKANVFDVTYKCKKCSDTGYIESMADVRRCSCLKQRMLEILNEMAGGFYSNDSDFSKFDETIFPDKANEAKYRSAISPRENILAVKEACLKFIDHFAESETRNLFFSGPTGTGKTFLTGCIAREVLKKGYSVMYQTAPNIFNLVNELKINGGSGDYEDLINADLLIIDDLGTENQSGSKYAEILNILITRSGNDSIKPPCKTIISSNLGLQEIYKVYDERIGSRIAGGFDMYRIFGDDLRLKYKKP